MAKAVMSPQIGKSAGRNAERILVGIAISSRIVEKMRRRFRVTEWSAFS
jgi:hypothetical protein